MTKFIFGFATKCSLASVERVSTFAKPVLGFRVHDLLLSGLLSVSSAQERGLFHSLTSGTQHIDQDLTQLQY